MEKRKIDLNIMKIRKGHPLFERYCTDIQELFVLQEIAHRNGEVSQDSIMRALNVFKHENAHNFRKT